MPGTQQGVGRRGDLLVRIDEVSKSRVEVRRQRVGAQDLRRQRFQTPIAGRRGERLLLGLVRKIEVFEPAGRVGLLDGAGQLRGQLSLRLDRTQDGLLAFGQLAALGHAIVNRPDRLFVEPAGLVFPIARDEGDGVAVVEQLENRGDPFGREVQRLGDGCQVDRDRRFEVRHGHAVRSIPTLSSGADRREVVGPRDIRGPSEAASDTHASIAGGGLPRGSDIITSWQSRRCATECQATEASRGARRAWFLHEGRQAHAAARRRSRQFRRTSDEKLFDSSRFDRTSPRRSADNSRAPSESASLGDFTIHNAATPGCGQACRRPTSKGFDA